MNNSMQDHNDGNDRVCKLLEMVWTTKDGFESGKKFCPSETPPPNCQDGVYIPKNFEVSIDSPTITWHACRDLCDTNDDCEYFKWKV